MNHAISFLEAGWHDVPLLVRANISRISYAIYWMPRIDSRNRAICQSSLTMAFRIYAA
jgi:hypothetical protein